MVLPLAALLTVAVVAQTPRQSAEPPPMGRNSWNGFGKQEINESIVQGVIDAIASDGLKEAGYKYVVIDGGWRNKDLGPDNEPLADPDKFPHGIKALADRAHSRGLKLGLHTVPGTHDCGGDKVGGYEKEILMNRECIAVDQDPSEQGRRIKVDGDIEIWAKHLAGQRMAVLLINRHASAAKTATMNWRDAGLDGTISARDIYQKKDIQAVGDSFQREIAPHGCAFLILAAGAADASPASRMPGK